MVLSSGVLKAQSDLTLYSLRSIEQSTYLNPAFMPQYDLSIGVPVLSGFMVNTQIEGITLNSIASNISSDSILDLKNLYNMINGNYLGVKVNVHTDFFHYRQQFGHYQVSLSSGLRTNSNVLISKDILDIVLSGNGDYIGKTRSFPMNIQFSSYIETALGVAREFENFTVGVRVKYLNGIFNVSSNNLAFNYFTDANSYNPSSFSLSGSINTSGVGGHVNMDDSGNVVMDTMLNQPSINPFSNTGIAFDFGVTYQPIPRLNLHFSALDLGSITWNNQVNNYDFSNISVSFAGVPGYVITDSVGTDHGFSVFKSKLQDTVIKTVQSALKNSVTNNSYSTPLVSRFIFGADYDLTLRDRIGTMISLQYFDGTIYPSYMLNYSHKFGNNFDLATHYSYFNNSFMNLGIGGSVKWGAFQFYAMQDDILFLLFPAYTHSIYFRFGCNLVFGEQRRRARF